MGLLKAILDTIVAQNENVEERRALLVNTLKIHQILTLIPANWENYKQESFLKETLASLEANKGLEYNPRKQTREGRLLEQASKSSSLIINSILNDQFPKAEDFKAEDFSSPLFSVKIVEEETNEKQDTMILNIQHLDLAHKANGKLGLYLHAKVCFNFFKFYCETEEPQDFKALVEKFSELKRLQGLQKTMVSFSQRYSKAPFTEQDYLKMVKEFGTNKKIMNKANLLQDIMKGVFISQIADDKESLSWLERILIQLLGHIQTSIRDQAVIMLNMLYDGVDWQLQQAFKPVIRCVGMHFKINILADFDHLIHADSQLFLGVLAPSPIQGQNKQILEWHKIQLRNIEKGEEEKTVKVDINFGKFWKCGFYDWRLVQINPQGQMKPLDLYHQETVREKIFGRVDEDEDDFFGTRLAQGRFIVHAKGLRDQIFHEIQVDYQDAKMNLKENKFTERGTFEKVKAGIQKYKKAGITALHLSGCQERDNQPVSDYEQGTVFRKANSSHTAVTSREKVNTMLGGDEEFSKLMTEAKRNEVKIVVDCFARISSSRAHRKYKELMLHYLDKEGRKKICYGTDGLALRYEDTAMLNYRKLESWDLLIEETVNFAKKYGVDGVQLDNGQAWPQIMEPDLEELTRNDTDGEAAYSPLDILNGEIVLKNENHGYWDTNSMEHYANPFFIKLVKQLWLNFPDFVVIAECWGGYMFESRQVILARSALVPRLFKLPQAIASCSGKKLYRDGKITDIQKQTVTSIKKWHSGSTKFLPEGTIQLQSSSAHVWPYPALVFKRGTWAAADILFFMPDVPITFMGEIDGQVFRIGETSVFQHEMQTKKEGAGLKRSNSQFMEQLRTNDEQEQEETAKYVDENGNLTSYSETTSKDEPKRGLQRVRSGAELSALKASQKQDLHSSQQQFEKQMGSQGFDLSKISMHYEHRRRLRKQKIALRYGEMIPLDAYHQHGKHQHVLAFARFSLLETAIIAVNLNEAEVFFQIDMSNLRTCFKNSYSSNTVVMVRDWMNEDSANEYYFMSEILRSGQSYQLGPYKTMLLGVTVCQDDSYVIKKALTRSIQRTIEKMRTGQSTESEQISIILNDLLENEYKDIQKLANFIGSVQESFLDKFQNIGFFDIANSNHRLRYDITLSSRLYALCTRISEICDTQNIAPKRAALDMVQKNTMGPIVFFTPELGRWSTAGGLGVMVDELSIGLADLGADVTVISPYYDKNRKGQTGYLSEDPAGITHAFNVEIQIDGKNFTFGAHEGVVDGVKVAFLHNSELLEKQYDDFKPYEAIRQLVAFAKASLEYLCKKQLIPSVAVTNDWFTGLVAGFAKNKFGTTFAGTTFFHIAHNLANDYEGRIYQQPGQDLQRVFELDYDLLVNKNWQKVIVNPTRCALLCSDSWGTVSRSYLEELMRESSQRDVMFGKSCKAFAHSNGIPVAARIKKLDVASSDHLDAKRKLQQKYFHFSDIDDSIPIFGFVGRVTEQKGVHLICESAEDLIKEFNGKIQFIVGGPASPKDPYAARCAAMMHDLKRRFPNNFWAAPDQFFMDGALINRGCDFGLMPSKFEPGGIVQHEFFVGCTPVVAFRTGGLKDSVFEYHWDIQEGTGFTFESYTAADMIHAMQRAISTFHDKKHYLKLRENAFKGVMHGETVCKAWLSEFCRLRTKISVDPAIVKETLLKCSVFNPNYYKAMKSFEDMFGAQKEAANNFLIEDVDFGAAEEESKQGEGKRERPEEEDERLPFVFQMHNYGKRYGTVQLCGSFDNWKVNHSMLFDQFCSQWFITLHLKKGSYQFKFVVDGDWRANRELDVEKDSSGNYNNILTLQ